MNTSTSRVYPKEVYKAEILCILTRVSDQINSLTIKLHLLTSQRPIQDFHSSSDKLPTACTNPLIPTASSNFIIISHINIENQFTLLWF